MVRNKTRCKLLLSALTFAAIVVAFSSQSFAIGLLIPNDRALPPLAIKSHRVNIDITDNASVTKVEQVFVNHTNRQLEATFIFPVPPGSTVSDFSLWINGRKTKGAVLEKNEARRIYESIVRRVEDPGLVEYMDGTLFQARIFPVPANGEQKVEISFASVLNQVGTMRRYLYPLKTGRRSAQLMQDFTLVANVSSRSPLKAVYSPSHRIAVSRKSDQKAIISVEENAADLERDFLLYMGTGTDDVGLSLLTYDKDGKGGDDGYFLMVLAPQIATNEKHRGGKSVTFVIDSSGSMIGEKMDQAKKALAYCLQKLSPRDQFNVIRFSTDVETLFTRPQQATKDAVSAGVNFAGRMEAAGGTAIDDALSTALTTQSNASNLPSYVIFLTDGRPTVGTTEIPEIIRNTSRNNRRRARIFTFGVGYDVNTTLLDRVASDNAGIADYVRPNEDIELKVTSLYNKIAYPALANVRVDYNTNGVYDTYPRQLPDLYRGGQVVVMGRYRRELPSTIHVKGRMGNELIEIAFDEELRGTGGSKAHDFIPKLWATRKVGYLLSEIRTKGELGELKTEVIRLAKKYGLVTPYTSYLAVDDSELQPTTPPPVVRPGPWDNRPRKGGDWNNAPGSATRAMPDAEPAEAEEDAFWGGEGAAGGRTAAKAPAPARKLYKAKKRREAVLGGGKGLSKDSGRDAVETSIATEQLKRVDTAGDADGLGTRYIDGQLFVWKKGAWRQDGVSSSGAIKVKYMSPAWFTIVKARPEVKARLALGESVVLKIGRKTVHIGSAGAAKLDTKTVSAW